MDYRVYHLSRKEVCRSIALAGLLTVAIAYLFYASWLGIVFFQNVDALPHTDPVEIKKNLVAQLTASVRWTQSVKNMIADGATDFTECGPGAVLQGLIKKIDGTVSAHGIV